MAGRLELPLLRSAALNGAGRAALMQVGRSRRSRSTNGVRSSCSPSDHPGESGTCTRALRWLGSIVRWYREGLVAREQRSGGGASRGTVVRHLLPGLPDMAAFRFGPPGMRPSPAISACSSCSATGRIPPGPGSSPSPWRRSSPTPGATRPPRTGISSRFSGRGGPVVPDGDWRSVGCPFVRTAGRVRRGETMAGRHDPSGDCRSGRRMPLRRGRDRGRLAGSAGRDRAGARSRDPGMPRRAPRYADRLEGRAALADGDGDRAIERLTSARGRSSAASRPRGQRACTELSLVEALIAAGRGRRRRSRPRRVSPGSRTRRGPDRDRAAAFDPGEVGLRVSPA